MIEVNVLPSIAPYSKKWHLYWIIPFFLVVLLLWLKWPVHSPSPPHSLAIIMPQDELKRTPLHRIHCVGFMRSGHLRWGILILPSGTIESIQVGTRIGREQAIVLAISEDGLELKTHNHPFNMPYS